VCIWFEEIFISMITIHDTRIKSIPFFSSCASLFNFFYDAKRTGCVDVQFLLYFVKRKSRDGLSYGREKIYLQY